MENTNTNWPNMSDAAIVDRIGEFVKHSRLAQNKTQAYLAEKAGLNRWTIGQMEKGEPISLSSLIQVLRALDKLYVLNSFEVQEEISPLKYAKLKKQQKQRASKTKSNSPNKEDLGW